MGITKFFQYTCVGFLSLVCVLLAVVVQHSLVPNGIEIGLQESDNRDGAFSPRELTDEEVARYEFDGYLLVRGLLSVEEALMLRKESELTVSRSFTIFDLFSSTAYGKLAFDLWRTNELIARLSLQALPRTVVAKIMGKPVSSSEVGDLSSEITATVRKIRLLRDAFFQYSSDKTGCGWHVDDAGFWPAEHDTGGMTIWIALDEMRVSEGGGLAIVNVNAVSDDFLKECREVLAKGTCAIEETHPECHKKFEQNKVQWDMNPGDAVLWDRWTFHRGVPAVDPSSRLNKIRYSVRYIPQEAKAKGFVHYSVPEGSEFQSPYYPQVWPSLLAEEVKALEHGLENDASISPGNAGRILLYLKYKIGNLLGLLG